MIALIVPINITGIRGERTVLEGNNLQLICEASSPVEPNITWTKKKPENQGNTGVVQVGKVLTITNINRNDAGNYTCTADNGFSKSENQTVYVIVTCEYQCIVKKLPPSLNRDALSTFIFCVVMYCAFIYLY